MQGNLGADVTLCKGDQVILDAFNQGAQYLWSDGSTNSTLNRSTQDSSRSKSNTPALRVIPLWGLHEIGKNTCVFEYGDELMLVDAGLAFPSDGMHGVNVVMPDTTFLKENQRRIKGMIVTHGHEDHIGGISHHLKQL